MSQQVIGVGTSANDNTGDPLRTAMQKANANFTELYATELLGVDTTGSTITLPFGSGILARQRRFYSLTSFSTPKTVVLDNDGDANHFTFLFEITDTLATLQFEAGFKSGDSRYNNPTPLMFTSDEIGIFKVTGDYNGTSWILEFSTLPAV